MYKSVNRGVNETFQDLCQNQFCQLITVGLKAGENEVHKKL